MVNEKYIASGQVVDRKTKQGVPGLRVEAWDKDQKYNDFLGVAITDRCGRFCISFDETYFREFAPDTSPDLFFKVYRGQNLIKSTEDSVIWNAGTATELTIEVDIPERQPVGNDRITARQVFRGVDFVQRSDFRGLWKEATDRSGAAFGFITDMIMNTITNMDIEPLKVGTHKTSDVINQDVDSARKNLEAQQVVVNEVKPYKPGLNTDSLSGITALPVRLRAGQKVNLYEENGRVRYYTIVREEAATDIKVDDSVKAQLATTEKELETIKQQSARKDQQIASLQKEVESLRAAQIKQETITRMEQDIQGLQAFKTNMEKTLKKSRKSSPDKEKKS